MTCQQDNQKCLTGDEKKYLVKFANSFYDEFRKLRYGINSCRKQRKLWLDELRKDIIEYQMNSNN